MFSPRLRQLLTGTCIVASLGFAASAHAQSLNFAPAQTTPVSLFQNLLQQDHGAPLQLVPQEIAPQRQTPQGGPTIEPQGGAAAMPDHLRRQVVTYHSHEAPGTIIVDTPNTYLYYVLGNGKAMRYGIGVGREGFTWSGVRTVGRKAEWPDWTPPAEMIARQPYLPRFMAGGPGNPLGARAMYLAGTIYRIHGTNNPSSIGQHLSSGCIRMLNEDAIDLYQRVNIGTKVVVLPDRPRTNRVASR